MLQATIRECNAIGTVFHGISAWIAPLTANVSGAISLWRQPVKVHQLWNYFHKRQYNIPVVRLMGETGKLNKGGLRD